jgi:hypothetical protein
VDGVHARFVWTLGYILSPLASVVTEKLEEEINPIPEMELLLPVDRDYTH